jgi:RND superfamily putative drug exporter
MFSVPVTSDHPAGGVRRVDRGGVPILLGAVGGELGDRPVALSSYLIPAQDATNSVILLIGMAVGVDYSLFYLKREREERARAATHLDAVESRRPRPGTRSWSPASPSSSRWRACSWPATTSSASSASARSWSWRVSVLGSLTMLPALLAKLGRWVDRPRIPFVWRLTAPRAGTPRFWSVVLRPALRHPVLTFLVSAGVLVALALPALGMNLKLITLTDLPRTTPVMQAYDRLTAAFPSTGHPARGRGEGARGAGR